METLRLSELRRQKADVFERLAEETVAELACKMRENPFKGTWEYSKKIVSPVIDYAEPGWPGLTELSVENAEHPLHKLIRDAFDPREVEVRIECTPADHQRNPSEARYFHLQVKIEEREESRLQMGFVRDANGTIVLSPE